MKARLYTALTGQAHWRALAAEWEGLRHAQPDLAHHGPFLSYPWVRLWLLHHAREARPWFVGIHDEHGLRALAPLVLWRRGARARLLLRPRVLGFPVRDDTGPLRCDVLLAPGSPAQQSGWLEALFDFILRRRRAWDELRLTGLHANSPTRRYLLRRFPAATLSEQPLSAARVLEAPADFAAWLAAGSPPLRKDVRYNRNCVAGAGAVHFTTARTPAEVARAMHGVRRILLARFAAGHVDQLPIADQRVIAFLERVVADFAARGAIDLRLFECDGRPLACMLSLVDGTHLYPLLTKYDPSARTLSPGRAVMLHLIEHARGDGYTRIDFLSDWPYLRRYTDRTEQYVEARVFHAGWASRLARWRGTARTPAAALPPAAEGGIA